MGEKIVCQNKKASYDYFIDEVMEAGLVLLGPEVKSLREGRCSLMDSYAKVKKEEVLLYNMHITPYTHAHHVRQSVSIEGQTQGPAQEKGDADGPAQLQAKAPRNHIVLATDAHPHICGNR